MKPRLGYKLVHMHVTVEVPAEVSWNHLAEHTRDAVSSWGGQYHPEDPLFGHLKTTVTPIRVTD